MTDRLGISVAGYKFLCTDDLKACGCPMTMDGLTGCLLRESARPFPQPHPPNQLLIPLAHHLRPQPPMGGVGIPSPVGRLPTLPRSLPVTRPPRVGCGGAGALGALAAAAPPPPHWGLGSLNI